MSKPPDIKRPPNIPQLRWDTTKTHNLNSNDPIFVLMTRTNTTETLKNISPFLIQKAIDATCGEVLKCKKILSGQILLKTKNSKQANKLITLVALSNTITIDITPHPSLNSSKGVIYCNDLRNIPEQEILQELIPQNVTEVKKIQKKVNNQLTETGLLILTFNTTALPNNINIGYLKVPIRPYIPPPMRCKNCLRYNHLAKYCKNPKTCPNCAENYHLIDETQEMCKENKKCVNCVTNNHSDHHHSALDKNCPIFIKEKEIQTIKVTTNVDNRTAKALYKQRHPPSNVTYATITSTHTPTNDPTHPPSATHHEQSTHEKSATKHQTPTIDIPPTQTTIIEAMQLTGEISESESDSETTIEPKQKIKIFPKNTPKRLRSQLKKTTKSIKTKATNKTQRNNDDFDPFDI